MGNKVLHFFDNIESYICRTLLAVQVMDPGVYAAFHNRVLPFPGVVKDAQQGTFAMADESRQQTADSRHR